MLINENMKYRIPCSFVLFPFQSYSVVSAGTYFPIKKIQINVHVWGKKNALSTQYKYMMLSGIEMSQGSKNGSDGGFEDLDISERCVHFLTQLDLGIKCYTAQ